MQKDKCVIYTRVSRDEQRVEGYSIDFQERGGRKYAANINLVVDAVFSESMSAKEPGRIEFNNMLKYIKKNNIKHIIFDKNDRASRNEIDSANLVYMARTTDTNIHLIRDNLVLNKKSKPTDFMIFNVNAAISSMYSLNLSGEITSKLLEKAKQGYWPMRSMVGYKRDPESRKARIIPDPEKAPFVVKCYELYATGLYSYETLAIKMREEGFYISKTHICDKRNIEDILNNPIYMGEFQFKDYYCKDAKHAPLISKELYYAVQNIIKSHNTQTTKKYKFLFSGLVKCGECGCAYTWENKKGAHNSGLYVYGHCTGNRGKECKKKYIREEQLENSVLDVLETLNISKEIKQMFFDAIKYNLDLSLQYDTAKLQSFLKKREDLNKRISKLLIGWADGIIDDDNYKKQHALWTEELRNIETNIAMTNSSSEHALENAKLIIELCNNPRQRYFQSSHDEKRALIKIMCSNLSVQGKEVTIVLHPAFEKLAKINKINKLETRGVEPLSKMD